jgi:hypothetical protein
MPKLAFAGCQPAGNLAQALGVTQLAKHHRNQSQSVASRLEKPRACRSAL